MNKVGLVTAPTSLHLLLRCDYAATSARLDADLLRATLSTLLGDLRPSSSMSDGSLCLVGPPLLLPLLLVVLGLGKSLSLSSGTDLGLLVPTSGNAVEGGTDDGTLVLDGAARTLLGSLLADALLVHAAGEDRPGDLARVLALEEEGLALRRDEAEGLRAFKEGMMVSF